MDSVQKKVKVASSTYPMTVVGAQHGEERSVQVNSQDFKFSCAHFVAFQGFRERLHGHNYTVEVRLFGKLCDDGYVIDFGDVKKIVKEACKDLNEYFLVPMKSDVIDINTVPHTRDGVTVGEQIELRTEDGSFFSIPASDCKCLPIRHVTAEELAEYLWDDVVQRLTMEFLCRRGIRTMEISVAERPIQRALYKRNLEWPDI